MPATSLTELQQQIAQHERELQTLRQELQSRQDHLSQLNRRREELLLQLREVDQEIDSLGAAPPAATEQSTAASATTPAAPSPAAQAEGQPRIGDLVVTLLQEARGPMTARQLHEEAQRRGFPSTSRDPIHAMENRLQQLKNKGLVQRASGQPGFVLISPTRGGHQEPARPSPSSQTSTPKAATKPARAKSAARKREGKASPSAGTATTPGPGRGGQPPLREVLTEILKKSRKPQFGSVLAAQVLATGYQSNSQNFTNTVTALLTNMDNVEHIAGQGYRLKRKA